MKFNRRESRVRGVPAASVLRQEAPTPRLPDFEASRDLRPEDFALLAQRTGPGNQLMNLAVAGLAFPDKLKGDAEALPGIRERLLKDVGAVDTSSNEWPEALGVGILQEHFPPGLVQA